jgi:3D (Asp-Asp-Asp) domain-containing protein
MIPCPRQYRFAAFGLSFLCLVPFAALRAPGAADASADPTLVAVDDDDELAALDRDVDGARRRRILRVTAYCDRGLTAAGVPSGVGQCAAPADIPFGSRVYIPSLGRTFIVTDRTARRFRHNTIDIYMPEREACKRFGRSYLECEITFPEVTHRYGSRSILAGAGESAN